MPLTTAPRQVLRGSIRKAQNTAPWGKVTAAVFGNNITRRRLCLCLVKEKNKNKTKTSERTAALPPERFFPHSPAPRCVFVSRWVTLLNSPTLLTDILFDRMLLDCSDAELLREVRKQWQHHRSWCPPAVYRMFPSHGCTAGLKTGVWKGVCTAQLDWTCKTDPANQIYLTSE